MLLRVWNSEPLALVYTYKKTEIKRRREEKKKFLFLKKRFRQDSIPLGGAATLRNHQKNLFFLSFFFSFGTPPARSHYHFVRESHGLMRFWMSEIPNPWGPTTKKIYIFSPFTRRVDGGGLFFYDLSVDQSVPSEGGLTIYWSFLMRVFIYTTASLWGNINWKAVLKFQQLFLEYYHTWDDFDKGL